MRTKERFAHVLAYFEQTMDDTARNELRDTLSASGVEHAVFWDDAAGIFK